VLNDFLNQALLDIYSRRSWGFLRRTHRFRTSAKTTITGSGGPGGWPRFVSGSRTVQLGGTAAGVVIAGFSSPHTSLGKQIVVDNRVYRVKMVSNDGAMWIIDQPFISASGQGIYDVDIIHDELALPLGAESVIEAAVIDGEVSKSFLNAIAPYAMVHRSVTVEGKPTEFSVDRKEPIPTPIYPPEVGLPAISTGNHGPIAGTYTYWISYADAQSGAESALSPPVSITTEFTLNLHPQIEVSVDSDLLLTTPAAASANLRNEAKQDLLVKFYRSRNGGSVPYLVEESDLTGVSGNGSTWTFADGMDDQELGVRAPESPSTLFLHLHPVPSSTYQVQVLYQLAPVTMGEDSDKPLFDSTFHPIVLDGAEALLLEQSDEQGRANQARSRFERGIQRMVARDRLNRQNTVTVGGPRKVRGKRTWWYGSLGP